MIEQFRGENFYLSNMYFLDEWITTDRGIKVPTAEHAYQAAKFTNLNDHRIVAETCARLEDRRIYADGLASKELANALVDLGTEIRYDWQVAKRGIMLAIVTQKFINNRNIAEQLIGTGDEMIVEGNDRGDRYWGVDPIGSDNGENHLGQILTTVRSSLQNDPSQIISHKFKHGTLGL